MDLGLEGQVVAITGGSSGIGLATAAILVDEGASLLLVSRCGDRLKSAAAELDRESQVKLAAIDVTSPTAGEEVLEAIRERFGRVNALVNGAGTTRARSLESLTDAEWQEQWELNVMAPKRLMDAVAPAMTASGGGAIVNICSSAGRRPSMTNAAYSVAKRAEIALTMVYAERWGPEGVRVNAVAPGPTGTPLWLGPGGLLDQHAEAGRQSRDEALREACMRLPARRLAEPAEVAVVVVRLLTATGSAPNGAVWSVDGGHVADVLS